MIPVTFLSLMSRSLTSSVTSFSGFHIRYFSSEFPTQKAHDPDDSTLKSAFNLLKSMETEKEGSTLFQLGYCYQFGIGTETDPVKALKYYTKCVRDNIDTNGESANALGGIYERGVRDPETKAFIIRPDHTNAVNLYARAASKGHLDATFRWANMLESGTGIEKDIENAISTYHFLAESGHVPSQLKLGKLYESGAGVTKSLEKSIRFYNMAAKSGNPAALYRLGVLFYYGDMNNNLYPEKPLGITYLKRSASEKRFPPAIHALSLIFYQGDPDVKISPDPKASFTLLSQAALKSYLPSVKLLAEFYSSGIGTEQDDFNSFSFWKIAADSGDPDALFQVGEAYLNGKGTKQDHRKAFSYFQKGAQLGHGPSLLKSAAFHHSGGPDGSIPINHALAAAQYQLAMVQGHSEALKPLASIFLQNRDGIEPNVDRSIRLVKALATDTGDVSGINMVSQVLKEGTDDIQPDPKAVQELQEFATSVTQVHKG